MANILDILTRAQALRQETALNSITPDRAGGIMYDTLILINQMQLEGGSLLISKVYSSVAAMEADTTPTSDLTGRALRPGQLAVIVPSSSTSSDMGSVYRYNEPGSWTLCGKIGGLPMDTVPIQGSSNGITSGAVYNALSALRDEGYKYMGVATPGSGGTNPGTPYQPVFYVAAAGSYPNFSNLTVASGHLGFLKYSNGSWTVESIEVGKDYDEEISQLRQKVTDIEGTLNGESEVITETVTLATIQTLTTSGLLKDDGVTVQASGAGIHSDFISLEGIDGDLSVTGWASNNKLVFFYDSTKTFLSYALSGKKSAEPVQIPPNAAYIRVNGLTASYLSGQGASEYATNITGTKTTTIQSGGLVADVQELKETTASLRQTVSNNTERIEALEGKTSDAVTKYIHFSFDDSYRILKYLYTDSHESIFEEPRMALCKQLHDEYGAVFSFYLFNDEINPQTEEVLWSIESTPSTYKAQFEACSDWIKFGYHTKNRNSNAGNFTVSELTADYARTIAVIQNCIGMDSLDRCPRLGGYNGSLDRVLALRDAPAGIIGLLGPDDTRQGYYMTNSQAAFLHSHDRWTDAENQLTFVATDLRLESSDVVDSIDTVIASWETSAKWNIVRELVLFTHEGVVFVEGNNIPSNMEAICQWAVQKGYKFDFPQNHIW